MEAALGVSIGAGEARIALLDATAAYTVRAQSRIDLGNDSLTDLAATLISTDRMLLQFGHRLTRTRICSADDPAADTLIGALSRAGLTDVAIVSESDAVTALVRDLSGGRTAAVVTADGDTASLSIVEACRASLIANESVGQTDRITAYSRLVERFRAELSGATTVIVLDPEADSDTVSRLIGRSPMPYLIPEAPEFAIARGAAMAAGYPQSRDPAMGFPSATGRTDSMPGSQNQYLAYSQVEDHDSAEFLAAIQASMTGSTALEVSGEDPDGPSTTPRSRVMLLGSTLAAIGIIGFAALAVMVAISIRPTVSHQAVRTQKEALPGKAFPISPGQGVQPDGKNWTVLENLPPAGQQVDYRVFEPKPLNPSLAFESTPIQLKLFPDGTLGLDAGELPAAPLAALSALPLGAAQNTAGTGTRGMDLVARLVPDLSRIDMTQVVTSLINNVRAANPIGTMASALASLNNAGSIAMVKRSHGPIPTAGPVRVLSDPPSALVEKIESGVDAAELATTSIAVTPVRVSDPPAVTPEPTTTVTASRAPAPEKAVPAKTAAEASTSEAPSSKATSALEDMPTVKLPGTGISATATPESTSGDQLSSVPAPSPTISATVPVPTRTQAPTTPAPASAPASTPVPAPSPAAAQAAEPVQAPAPVAVPAVTPRDVAIPAPVPAPPVVVKAPEQAVPAIQVPWPRVTIPAATTTPVPSPAEEKP